MKLKYYLRGLGIGIAVTAFIMSRVSKTEELTDAQIKMRALELGMVEEIVLADLPQATDENVTETPENNLEEKTDFDYTAGEAEIDNARETDIMESAEEENSNIGESDNLSQSAEETKLNTEAQTAQAETTINSNEEITEEYVLISIEAGNGSETVSRKLYNAGLVESAVEFNRFLVANGYDRILNVGNHEIPVGVSEEDIAKILCGLQ